MFASKCAAETAVNRLIDKKAQLTQGLRDSRACMKTSMVEN